MSQREQQLDAMVNSYSIEELKAVCSAVQSQIIDGDGAAVDILRADLIELQDEYDLWATALERKLAYDSAA